MRLWPPRPARNGITTQHKSFHPTDPPYQVSPRLSLITNPSIESPCHNSFGGPSSEALIASPLCLLHLNASTRSSLFVKLLGFSVRITFIINVRHCHLPPLIVTPHYKLAKTIYPHRSTQMRPIIQPIGTYPSSSVRLINPRRVNCTHQIFFTAAIKEAMIKGFIKSVIKMLTHIQKTSIYPLSRKTRRFNIQIKDLMRWTLILFVLRLCVGNVEPLFPQNPDSTNT